jgi:phosphoribosylanthranilate isomerase
MKSEQMPNHNFKMMQAKLKICGMRDPVNIAQVAALQPDYLGFIFYPKSKRHVDNLPAATLNAIPDAICKTGVFVDEQLHQVQEYIAKYRLSAVQLHGEECPNYCQALKKLNPSITLIKAFGLAEGFDFNVLDPYQKIVDYFLFDTQTPGYGGSGKSFNWSLLQDYHLKVPYFLSGGIGLESMQELQQINDPYLFAIDINSKFELAPGLKDIAKLTEFKNKLFPLSAQTNGIK